MGSYSAVPGSACGGAEEVEVRGRCVAAAGESTGDDTNTTTNTTTGRRGVRAA